MNFKTNMKQDASLLASSVQETKTVIEPAAVKKTRIKRSPPSSPSIIIKKRPGPPSKDEDNQYSPHELEMETKLADYFQMNCDLCMHRFSSWSDARSHYLNRHNNLKPFLRCCNRKYFLRNRIIEHIIWHVDPSSFWYCTFLFKC